MDRRSLLAVGGLLTAGGYLGWNWYRSPTIPDGMNVETLYRERNVRAETPHQGGSLAWKEDDHVLLSDVESATDKLVTDGSVGEFVDETDFDESYLLLVQNGMQSEPDLELSAIKRTDGGLHLEISIYAPWFGVADDLVTHSLLLRITDRDGGVPETITVDISGYI